MKGFVRPAGGRPGRFAAVRAAGAALIVLAAAGPAPTAPAATPARPAAVPVFPARYRIGAVFALTGRPRHFCTAGVVTSPHRNLVVTAAHCVHGGPGGGYRTELAFAPGYRAGGAPAGLWRVRRVFVAPRWTTAGDAAIDVAFLALETRAGAAVEDLVGGNPLLTGVVPGAVRLVGYPASSEEAVTCAARAERPHPQRLRVRCPGFTVGTSGSPWVAGDGRREDGPVVGVIGGYQHGGATPDVSYSSYFDASVGELYRRAATGSGGT